MRLSNQGFTLIEMMVTIVIIGILASIGLPAYRDTVTSMRMSATINALSNTLNFARTEAMKRGLITSVCPIAGTACNVTTNWSGGWSTLVNSTSTQLSIAPSLSNGDTLTSSLTTPPQFNPAGYTFFTGTITLNNASSTASLRRCIVFNGGTWKINKGTLCP